MHIHLTYEYLTRHVVPGPYWPAFIPALLVLPGALLIPRHILSRTASICIFVPLTVALIAISCYQANGLDVIAIDTLLWTFFLLALRDPWTDFRCLDATKLFSDQKTFRRQDVIGESKDKSASLKTASDSDEQTSVLKTKATPTRPARLRKRVSFRSIEQSYPDTLAARLPWVLKLTSSIRLTNWKVGIYSHDKVQPSRPAFGNRREFVIRTVTSFVRGYLILDFTRAYIEHDAFFTNLSVAITDPLPKFSLLSNIPPHLVRTAITGAQAWAAISEMFYLPCLLPIALNYYGLLADEWSPHTWPPYFGRFGILFTHGVRGFWGSYWHQTMRWTVAGPGYALADAFRLAQEHALLRYAIIALSAFLFSGIVHMGLVPPEPAHATLPTHQVRLLVAGFFWVQPVAVIFETVVAEVAYVAKPRASWQRGWPLTIRVVTNLVWLFAWFSTSVIFLSEAGRQLGYWRVWPVPISIWRGLHGQGWIAWPFLLA